MQSLLQLTPMNACGQALYSGTFPQRTPLGPSWLPCVEVSVVHMCICTPLYVTGTADSVLIREVTLIQSVLYRKVPLYMSKGSHGALLL